MAERRRHSTRRQFVLAAGTAATAGVAGCRGARGRNGTGGTRTATGTNEQGGESTTVAILAAGSLQNALATGLEPVVDVPVRTEAHGSATVARMIAEGQRDPDIVTVADVALFGEPLSPPWHSVFASNAVVIAYNPDTEGGQRLAAAGTDNWYEPLADGTVDVGRTDPDGDPLGYRTLFVFELATRYYEDASNLGERIPERNQIYPETSLLSQFETGSIDAAIAYRNMAIERGYEFIELPDRIDLSNPAHAENWYSRTSYRLPGGREIRGDAISYGSTARRMTDATLAVFAIHTTGGYLEEHGFLLRDQFPAYAGEVPRRVREATARSAGNRSRLDGPRGALSSAVSEITVLI